MGEIRDKDVSKSHNLEIDSSFLKATHILGIMSMFNKETVSFHWYNKVYRT